MAEDIEKKELDGFEFVCFTPHSRTSGEGLKGTFLREYEVLLRRKGER